MDTNNLKPNLEPLTIIANITNKDEIDDKEIIVIRIVNKDIINISKLRSIKMILFRHQHILRVLIITIIINKFIDRLSTSKVDIFIKLFRTFVNINNCRRFNIY